MTSRPGYFTTPTREVRMDFVEQPTHLPVNFQNWNPNDKSCIIYGQFSNPTAETYPTIRISGYVGPVLLQLSCIKKFSFKAHPNKIVAVPGPDRVVDTAGSCRITTQVINADTNIPLPGLGIQFSYDKDFQRNTIQERRRMNIDPFHKGFDKCGGTNIQACRLGIQAFGALNENGVIVAVPLTSAASNAICSKCDGGPLYIRDLSDREIPAIGRKRMILLCDPIVDIKNTGLMFTEFNNQDGVNWMRLVDFELNRKWLTFHKGVAIGFFPPAYHNLNITESVKVDVQLYRRKDSIKYDMELGNAVEMKYVPVRSQPAPVQNLVQNLIQVQDNDISSTSAGRDKQQIEEEPVVQEFQWGFVRDPAEDNEPSSSTSEPANQNHITSQPKPAPLKPSNTFNTGHQPNQNHTEYHQQPDSTANENTCPNTRRAVMAPGGKGRQHFSHQIIWNNEEEKEHLLADIEEFLRSEMSFPLPSPPFRI